MKKIIGMLMAMSVLTLVSVSFADCGADHSAKSAAVSAATCPKCGEVAGSDKCCAADAKVCPKCGLHAGSPGCAAKCAPAAVPAAPAEAAPAP